MHNPPGATIILSPGPPFPTDGIVLFMIFHFQAIVTDMIVVFSPSVFCLKLAATDDVH